MSVKEIKDELRRLGVVSVSGIVEVSDLRDRLREEYLKVEKKKQDKLKEEKQEREEEIKSK